MQPPVPPRQGTFSLSRPKGAQHLMKQLYTMISPDEYLRLECLKLALQDTNAVYAYMHMDAVTNRADAFLRYVKAATTQAEEEKLRYRLEEIPDGEIGPTP
jgi:hypothetical protein